MEKNNFIKKHFYQLIIENKFYDAYQYLLRTNNIDLILKYQKKYKKFRRIEKNNEITFYEEKVNNLIINLQLYYFNKLIKKNNKVISFVNLKENLQRIPNIYYLVNNDDIIIWKNINKLFIDCRLLECNYHFEFYVISGFLFKGYINFISLNKISLNYFIFNNKLYINKSYYQTNLRSKKFKLFLISQAQFFYDLNSKKFTYEEVIIRKEKIVEIYKNNS